MYDLYWDSYQAGDVEAFASTLDDNFEMIGTSESELSHSKEEGIEYYKGQVEEVIGKAEMRYREINEVPLYGQVLINELCDLYTHMDAEWSFYSKLRISTLLRETPSGWKVVQQHCSLPDTRVLEGETLAIEKISKENLELRDAVKRRTAELENKNRELEIEAALERVRARSLAMHQSSELQQVADEVYEQMNGLGLQIDAVVMSGQIVAHTDYEVWVGGSAFDAPLLIPYTDSIKVQRDYNELIASRPELFTNTYSGKAKKEYIDFLLEENEFPTELKKQMVESESFSTSITFNKNSSLRVVSYSDQAYTDEENEIIKRFGKVFEQAYIRFMDLEKAEKQA